MNLCGSTFPNQFSCGAAQRSAADATLADGPTQESRLPQPRLPNAKPDANTNEKSKAGKDRFAKIAVCMILLR